MRNLKVPQNRAKSGRSEMVNGKEKKEEYMY